MKKIFKDYLFNKHIFVYEEETHENALETLCALANLFGIRIVKGYEFAEKAMPDKRQTTQVAGKNSRYNDF